MEPGDEEQVNYRRMYAEVWLDAVCGRQDAVASDGVKDGESEQVSSLAATLPGSYFGTVCQEFALSEQVMSEFRSRYGTSLRGMYNKSMEKGRFNTVLVSDKPEQHCIHDGKRFRAFLRKHPKAPCTELYGIGACKHVNRCIWKQVALHIHH